MTAIVQQKRAYTASTSPSTPVSLTATLDATPASGSLCLLVAEIDKAGTAFTTTPAGFTKHAEYVGASVGLAVASGTAQSSASWGWTASRGGRTGLYELDITNTWAVAEAAAYPSPVNDTNVTSISGDLGSAEADGVIIAVCGIDTSIEDQPSHGLTAPKPDFSGGYTLLDRATPSTNNPEAQGTGSVAYVIATKTVTAGDSTAVTVDWAGRNSDQAALILIRVEVEPAPPTPTVTQRWLGVDRLAVTTTNAASVRVAFSASSDMPSPTYTSAATPDAQGVSLHALPAASTRYYQVEADGTLIGAVQQFTTLPDTTAQSFSFGFASCRNTDQNPTALANVVARGIDLFIETGDFHYRDLTTTDQATIRASYDELHTRSNIAALLAGTPTDYTWSDHDYSGVKDSTAPNRAQVRAVYRERVPSPTLPGDGIHHTFRVGRCRFIVLDTRSYRSPSGNTDNSSKTMLGTEQKTWLQGLLASSDTPLTFIVSAEPWNAATADDDHWGSYQTERATVADWITAAGTTVVMLSGDAHMLAIDDGTNAAAGVHCWQAAALSQNGSTKGGPWSGGTLAGTNQYGYVAVTDDGAQIVATFTGYRSDDTAWSSDTVTVDTAEPEPEPEPEVETASRGGWGALQALLAEARTWRRPPGTDCPRCGQRLDQVRGGLHCRWDGYIA